MVQTQTITAAPAFNTIERMNTTNIDQQKLTELAVVDNATLITITSIFPFDLFPNTISVDRTKVNIQDYYFFFSHRTQSILIKDLITVVIQDSIFFSSIQIVDRFFSQDPIVINHLPKNKAHQLKQIVEGLLVAHREQIDVSRISDRELVSKVQQIGKSHIS